MTSSPPAVLLGSRLPRVMSVPPAVSSAGQEAVELAATAGLHLDPWQQFVLEKALGERADGRWAAFEVALIVPRQNGKGAVIEARELAGLFLFGEQLILHSAHEFKTAQEAFRRILMLVENAPHLERMVKRVRTSHGEEGIELKTGARLRFVARSTGSGRGFSGDLVILDEAFNLSGDAMAALLPTLSARPNPQLWYVSSAGLETSEQLARVRDRGIAGNDPALCYLEYSADPKCDLDDREAWAQANPALGIRISEEFIERERNALPEAEFARERLGIWDDPRTATVVDLDRWAELTDRLSELDGRPAFAVDVPPDRSAAAIGVGGRRADGIGHIEVVEHRRGTGWVVERLAELVEKWRPVCPVAVDATGPAGSLIAPLNDAGVETMNVSTRDMAAACGGFVDAVSEGRIRHLGQPKLTTALAAARKRPLGDAFGWRRYDNTDISPLVAVTLAWHAYLTHAKERPKKVRTGKVW